MEGWIMAVGSLGIAAGFGYVVTLLTQERRKDAEPEAPQPRERRIGEGRVLFTI